MQQTDSPVQDSGQKYGADGRLTFLDVLKGLAIIAVICDHSKCWSLLCPLTFLPHTVTFYSVTLFILCAGYTSALSLERSKESSFLWIRRKVVHIFVYYLVGTIVYLFFETPGHVIYFSKFMDSLINFKACITFYFMAFFLQLLFVAPFFYQIFSSRGGKLHSFFKVLFYLFTLLLSYGCMRYTCIENIGLGGHYLLGGTYLACYVTGQIICIYRHFFFRKLVNLICLAASAALLFIFQSRHFNGIPLICNINPPGMRLIFYAATIFFAISLLFLFLPKILSKILSLVSFLGKYSLEIFLYHLLIMRFFGNYFRFGTGAKEIVICKVLPTWKLFSSRGLVFPDTPALKFLIGTAAFICYLFVPVLLTMLYRYLRKLLDFYIKPELSRIDIAKKS